MKSRLNKQEKEKLDNKIVFLSSGIFLYAILLAFIHRMSIDTITLAGADAFKSILKWAALVGAMACAAWSAYKEKKGFFVYCIACIYVFLSITVLEYCTARSSNVPYLINYAALVAIFIFGQVYYALKLSVQFEKRNVRTAFLVACLVVALVFVIISLTQINSVYFIAPMMN